MLCGLPLLTGLLILWVRMNKLERKSKAQPEYLILAPDGAWLQSVDLEGRVRLSWCGRLSLEAAKLFCGSNDVELVVVESGQDKLPPFGTSGLVRCCRSSGG